MPNNSTAIETFVLYFTNMHVLVIYATNSGGTQTAADIVSIVLKNKHLEITVKEAGEVNPNDITEYPAIVIGSCTWDYNGLEGQPHEHIVEMLKKLDKLPAWTDKSLAMFGLGDSSYTYFCGSVTYMETFAKRNKARLIIPSLKIDGFFYKQQENTATLQKWASDLATALNG